jgi:pyridoxamine 5'-phosphate oxidase family protein
MLADSTLPIARKYRDVQSNPHVAIVIDDLASTDPGDRDGRGRSEAEILPSGGEAIGRDFDPYILRIDPKRIVVT